MNIKRTPEEEAAIAQQAAEPSLLKDVGTELFDSDNSYLARKKKLLKDRISDWSMDNINMPLKNAGYPQAGAILGTIPETVAEVALPNSGMDLIPYERGLAKIGGGLSKVITKMGRPGTAAERVALRDAEAAKKLAEKAAATEKAHVGIAKDIEAARPSATTKIDNDVEKWVADAAAHHKSKTGTDLPAAVADQLRARAREKLLGNDVVKQAGQMDAEQKQQSITKDLTATPEKQTQTFKKTPYDDVLTPSEKSVIINNKDFTNPQDIEAALMYAAKRKLGSK